MHKQGVKRNLLSDKWEFDARIQARNVSMIGRFDRSRKRSQFVPFRCIPQWVILSRMCIWIIHNGRWGRASAEVC